MVPLENQTVRSSKELKTSLGPQRRNHQAEENPGHDPSIHILCPQASVLCFMAWNGVSPLTFISSGFLEASSFGGTHLIRESCMILRCISAHEVLIIVSWILVQERRAFQTCGRLVHGKFAGLYVLWLLASRCIS